LTSATATPRSSWVAIAAAGNAYRHEYEAVDETLIWHTAQRGLDDLRQVCEQEFQSLQTPRLNPE
jgi:uncharacterized protein with HEPN domain